jgi:hypothetical protein
MKIRILGTSPEKFIWKGFIYGDEFSGQFQHCLFAVCLLLKLQQQEQLHDSYLFILLQTGGIT